MMTTHDTPRIYVACLAAYNSGRLHGRWIDAGDVDSINEEVAAMLKTSPEPGAEEWAIHDFDNFGPIRLSEYESFERVAELAGAIEEHGADIVSAYLDQIGSDEPVDGLADCLQGEYEDKEAYAYEYAQETGYVPIGSGEPMPYHDDWSAFIDWRAVASMLFDGGDAYYYDDTTRTVWSVR